MAIDKSHTFSKVKIQIVDRREGGGMGRETRGNFSDVEETVVGWPNNAQLKVAY